MFKPHPLAWFEAKVDQIVYRNNRPFPIKNKADAVYCHALQQDGFVFRAVDEGKRPRIHISDGACVSCEG